MRFREIFSKLEIELPDECGAFTDETYRLLSQKLTSLPSDTDPDFINLLYSFEQLRRSDSAEVEQKLHELSEAHNIEERFLAKNGLAESEELTKEELIVALLLSPQTSNILSNFINCVAIDRSSFFYFDAKDYTGDFVQPTPEDCTALRDRFLTTCKKDLKIKNDYCEVNMLVRQVEYEVVKGGEEKIHKETEWWFSVSRGARPVVSGNIQGNEVKTLTFIPPTTEVIVFSPRTRQLRTNVSAKARRVVYIKEFARLLTKQDGVKFSASDTYTFAPLEHEDWRRNITTAGLANLLHVRLKEVQCVAKIGTRVTYRAAPGRCLALLETNDELAVHRPYDWERLPGYMLPPQKFTCTTRAVLRFVFKGESKNPVTVKIMGPNQFTVSRKDHEPDIRNWLDEHGFILHADEEEVEELGE